MRYHFRRITGLLLLLCVLTQAFIPALSEESFETLRVGSRGAAVLQLKQRLFSLGYFRSDNSFTKTYSEDTAKKIRAFQQANGLPETGETDAMTWQILFSDTAVHAPRETMVPLATPGPTPVPDWPERDSEGYLQGAGEYFYENDDEGLWIYLSQNLQITILRREDASVPLIWFETEILTRNGEAFRTVMTDPEHPGKKYQYPYVISRNEQFVLAFSDDFYANRMQTKETVGIILREGTLLSTHTNSKRGHHLPNLDMMAQFPNGSLRVYECNEITPEELQTLGAVNVFSFGPILIRDGEIDPLVDVYYKSIEPRHAIGMIAPNHYLVLSVQGRTDGSRGTTLQRVAELMQARGVQQALNLDGGNTMALIFRGRMLNKLAVYKKKKFVRTVTSLIGIGYTDNQED